MNKISDVIFSVFIMILITCSVLYSAKMMSDRVFKKDTLDMPNEKQRPQIQEELIEIKKVGE